jgi:hypothetical protein
MSDEPKKQDGKWLSWGSATVFMLALRAAYQGAHYATAATVHRPGYCCLLCTHSIAGKEAPEWVDDCFWLAYRIDDLTGVYPWHWH